jgi:SAM-dependent methyltransferase
MSDASDTDASDWWTDFFSGPWLPFQRDHASGEPNTAIALSIASLLDLEPGDAVLDAPCGNGRIAVELADLGYAVSGLDHSQTWLDEAARAADDRGVCIDWVRGDMRAPPERKRDHRPERGFDAIVCYWNSFGYFDDAGNRDHARAMHRALAPGGRLLLDTISLETYAASFQPRGWWRAGDMLVVEERGYDPLRGRWQVEWTFFDGERRLGVRTSDVRIYSAVELATLLREVGFADIALYGAVDGAPFTLDAAQLVVVATRGP